MSVSVTCPNCRTAYSMAGQTLGSQAQCQQCGNSFTLAVSADETGTPRDASSAPATASATGNVDPATSPQVALSKCPLTKRVFSGRWLAALGATAAVLLGGVVYVGTTRRDPAAAAEPLTAPFSAQKATAAQQAWARHLGKKVVERNSVGMELVLIPPGKFKIGSPDGEQERDDNEHQADVTLTKAFWLGRTEVTQAQWKAVMNTEPWKGKPYVQDGPEYPATHVSWEDATEYCQALTEAERRAGHLPDDWTYQLPTEAQWEYACRAGTTTPYHFRADENDLREYAWYQSNAYNTNENYAHEVGRKAANPFGLADMHGNLWEWCRDAYDENYYQQFSATGAFDPKGPDGEKKDRRVLRGGSYAIYDTRSAHRFGYLPDYRYSDVGFRVAKVH